MERSLQILLLLSVVIAAAKGAGALARRLGQPAVFGELLAGLLLGPSALNLLHWPVFTDPGYLQQWIMDVAELGAIFLMFLAGLETDVAAVRKVGTAATMAALGGMALPFGAAALIGRAMGYPWYASVFMGTILTATSVSISAQTLLELGQLRSRAGTAILGAAVIDDVLGILLLSVVVALHTGGGAGAGIGMLLLRMALFFGVGIAIGRWAVPALLRAAHRWHGQEVPFATAVVVGLLFAFGAAYFGKVAAITGAYVAGALIAPDRELRQMVEERLRPLAYGFLVPVFLVSVGLLGDFLGALRTDAALAAWLLLAAVAGKVLGSGLAVRPFGFSWREAAQVGAGMVSRGEVGLIIAAIGLQNGVIDGGVYAAMVLMVLVTTLVTPVLLRLTTPAAAT